MLEGKPYLRQMLSFLTAATMHIPIFLSPISEMLTEREFDITKTDRTKPANQTKLYLAAPTCAALTTNMVPMYSKQRLTDIIGAFLNGRLRRIITY